MGIVQRSVWCFCTLRVIDCSCGFSLSYGDPYCIKAWLARGLLNKASKENGQNAVLYPGYNSNQCTCQQASFMDKLSPRSFHFTDGPCRWNPQRGRKARDALTILPVQLMGLAQRTYCLTYRTEPEESKIIYAVHPCATFLLRADQ
jgi:hypothetical protein